MVVQMELEKLGFQLTAISLGVVTLKEAISPFERQKIKSVLAQFDFELLVDKKEKIIAQIKKLIIELVQEKNNHLPLTLSTHLSQTLLYDYNYLSNLFSGLEGTTIEQFYIRQKVEKIKELLTYGELSLTEIAHQLHYSSVAHLSSQFKKITRLTTSQFKHSHSKNRKSIDKL